MKKLVLFAAIVAVVSFSSCKKAATEEVAPASEEVTVVEEAAPVVEEAVSDSTAVEVAPAVAE
jgi:TPP-dependent indolepyruvate ferredoxin oxidoreductase alpha subunit